MLRNRVIPIVLLDGYSVVKTIQFDIRRNLGNPIVVSRIYESRNVDELILLDIDASRENRSIDLHTVEAVSCECFMPLTIGGGLKTCQDIENALKAGADKVSLNSIIFENPYFLKEAVSVFGSQCIVASIDIKKDNSGEYVLFSNSGKDIKFSLEECLSLLIDSKVGEVLLNNVDLDGMMTGYDLDLIKYVSSRVNTPVIAAGGASKPEDCVKAVKAGASAVAVASIFHFTSITPRICKEAMANAGIPTRI
ncbi:MAG: imidazole glycerol phosphate synthase subunit HisF [Candidatus Omnitrophica bacterium]|nr:imidazole glycerol phosphate synthase subunit HisF [Candidatus Omnitrophota bacterium]